MVFGFFFGWIWVLRRVELFCVCWVVHGPLSVVGVGFGAVTHFVEVALVWVVVDVHVGGVWEVFVVEGPGSGASGRGMAGLVARHVVQWRADVSVSVAVVIVPDLGRGVGDLLVVRPDC